MTAQEINTLRLRLRMLTDSDVSPIHSGFFADPDCVRFTGEALHEAEFDTFLWMKGALASESRITWVFYLSGELIGFGGLEHNWKVHTCELAYYILPQHWGRGYATEAAEAMADYAANALGAGRITAKHAVDNPASGAVLKK